MDEYIELIDKYRIVQSKDTDYNPPSYEWVDNTGQIVRCKDCKHRPKGTGANHDLEFPDYVCPCQCEDYYYSWMPKDNWFCKDGERKES